MAGLTEQQEKFCQAYVECGNASEAYRRAYPRAKNWKPESVHRKAHELLGNVKIMSRLDELRRPALKKAEVTAERVVKELARIAFGDKRELMEWGPNGVVLKSSDGLSEDQAAMVAEVSETISQGGCSIKLKTYDKVKALELLGRYLGMFVEKREVTNRLELTRDQQAVLQEIEKRADAGLG